MHTVTDAFNAACSAPGREITSKINFNGLTDLPASEIQEIIVTEQFGSSDGVTIGAAFSSSCKVTMYKQDNLPLNGAYFIPSVGIMVDGEAQYVPKGKYYIPADGVEDSGKLWVTITGYDRMASLTDNYAPTIDFPATPAQILADVCTQGNVTAPSVTLPNIKIAAPYTGSLRQQLGWLAGLIGCNAKFDSAGRLTFCWYADSNLTVGWDVQYMGGLSLTADAEFTINSLLTGTESNPISVGSGIGITTTNPYITQEVAETVFAKLSGKTMMPCKVKWRGNPAVEAGDIVSVTDSDGNALNVYVMEQALHVKGGMYAETTCYAPADTDYAVASPTEQKFQRMYSDVIKSFQDATQKIIGAKGGYFEITYNDDGYPTGWTLKNTPTVEANTKMWIMSIGGLGFSADGGKTISPVALTMDGAIDGSALAIGSVRQDAVSGLSQQFSAIDGELKSRITKDTADSTYATSSAVSELSQNVDKITASISNTYVTKSDYDGKVSEIENNVSSLSVLPEKISGIVNSTDEKFRQVGNDLQSFKTTVEESFDFTTSGLYIGKSGNAVRLRLDNDTVQFIRGDTAELEITEKGVETDSVDTSLLVVGNVIHEKDDNGDEIIY